MPFSLATRYNLQQYILQFGVATVETVEGRRPSGRELPTNWHVDCYHADLIEIKTYTDQLPRYNKKS